MKKSTGQTSVPPLPKTANVLIGAALLLALGLLGLLTLGSLLISSRLPTTDPVETVLYRWDLFPLTLAVAAGLVALLAVAVRRGWPHPPQRVLTAVLVGWALALGTVWVLAVRVRPFADTYFVHTLAGQFAAGHYLGLEDEYVRWFPFQLGYIFVMEMAKRLTGLGSYLLLQLMNVAATAGCYYCIVKLTDIMFKRPKITYLVTLLLFGCLPPVLYATLVYGNMLGLAFSMAGFLFLGLFVQSRQAIWLLPMAFSAGFAVLVKNNCLIFAIAMGAVLLLDLLQTCRPGVAAKAVAAPAAGLAGLVLAVWLMQAGVQGYYRARGGQPTPEGMPTVLWVAMGLQDGPKAPGWFNEWSYEAYRAAGEDAALAEAAGRQSVSESVTGMAADPGRAIGFFTKKNVAQWLEPTYASLQHSHCLNTHDQTLPGWAKSLYEGILGTVYYEGMNIYQFMIFGLAFLWLVWNWRRADDMAGGLNSLNTAPAAKAAQATPPRHLQAGLMLAVFGGFLFHTVWEGKAMYILPYFVACLPFAAAGLSALLARITARWPVKGAKTQKS